MSVCYMCGTSGDKHLLGCPNITSTKIPATTTDGPKALITERDPVLVAFLHSTGIWRVAKICKGEMIPYWASHGWYLDDENDRGRTGLTIVELAKIWSGSRDGAFPGWAIGHRNLRPEMLFSGSPHSSMLVFAKLN